MVGGSSSNDGKYTVAGVTATTFTLANSDSLTTEAAGDSVTVTNGVLVRVRAFNQTNVIFSTSLGVWDGGPSAVTTKAPVSGYAWAVLTSGDAGSATVQANDKDNTAITDRTTVAFSAPSGDAARITLQASTYVVARSTITTKNTATLNALVTSAAGQVVGSAPVVFSVSNTTGGGETVSPVLVLTDSSGVATATFTSGSLSTSAEGVEITAKVLDEGETVANTTISFSDNTPAPSTITRTDAGSFVTDGFEGGEHIRVTGSAANDGYYFVADVAAKTLTLQTNERLNNESAGARVTLTAVTSSINIVIGGKAGSVIVGAGSQPEEVNDAIYRLAMSVLVADSNGNPVPGAVVSLSAWPAQYSCGIWYDRDGYGSSIPDYVPYITGTFINEDINANMILDPGEDTNADGELTPRNSAAGNVPDTVTTDENGVMQFYLTYLKSSARWIRTQIRASTEVIGTEISSSLEFDLPPMRSSVTSEVDTKLPDSPYAVYLVTNDTDSKSRTFPPLGVNSVNNPDSFTPTSPLTAGISNVTNTAGAAHSYTYTPTGGTPAKVGDVVWDWITGKGASYDWSSASDSDLTVYFPVRIAVKYGSAVGSIITLTATPNELTADGVKTSIIRASVMNSQGQVVADGTVVSFTRTLGNLSAATATTISGVATVTLTAGTTAGTSTVTATTADGATDSVNVTFVAGAVNTVTVSATPGTVEADGTSTIKATATDAYGNRVSGNTVAFTVVNGTLSASSAVTDAGIATVTYTAPDTVPAGGTDTVTATSSNNKTGTVNITVTAVPVGSVTVTAGSSTIVADGADSTVIRATVTNTAGGNVEDGTTVSFTTTAGTLSAATSTTVNGVATVTLTSATDLGTATIKATCSGVNASTTVTFIAGAVKTVTVLATPDNLSADGASTSTIKATVTDADSNVVSGETINFTAVSGTLSAASSVTDASGIATVTYTAPYAVPGAARIRLQPHPPTPRQARIP